MLAEYKVPGGKLVAAETQAEHGRILRVKITGDFFMHPEAAIADLEAALTGIPVAGIEEAVNRFFSTREVTLFGIALGDFAHVVEMSLHS